MIDKPAGIVVFPEGNIKEKTLIDFLIEKQPELENTGESPRYGIVHRLDKETSGVLVVAKNDDTLKFFQKEFKESRVKKEYIALCSGNVSRDKKIIETLIGRAPKDRRKQKAFPLYQSQISGLRKAITKLEVLKKFKNYTLIKAVPRTGRKHQIRCHLAHIGHPIAGDKIYGFRGQSAPDNLTRQFLHASAIEIEAPTGKWGKFFSELPPDLQSVIEKAKELKSNYE